MMQTATTEIRSLGEMTALVREALEDAASYRDAAQAVLEICGERGVHSTVLEDIMIYGLMQLARIEMTRSRRVQLQTWTKEAKQSEQTEGRRTVDLAPYNPVARMTRQETITQTQKIRAVWDMEFMTPTGRVALANMTRAQVRYQRTLYYDLKDRNGRWATFFETLETRLGEGENDEVVVADVLREDEVEEMARTSAIAP